MTVRVGDVCAALDKLAPPALAYEWDKPGLSIGDPNWQTSKVLVALTVTPHAVRVAKRRRADMIVSHHPAIWDPLRALRTDDPHTRMCLELVQARIACFAAHTNLDVAPGGVNDLLADALGLTHRAPLWPVPHAGMVKLITFVPEAHVAAVRRAVCEAGAGEIGAYTFCTFSTPGMGTFLPGDDAQPFSGRKRVVNEEPERRVETLVAKTKLPHVLEALRSAHPYEEPAYDIVSLENPDPKVGLGVRGHVPPGTTLGSLARRVRDALRVGHVRTVGHLKRRVRTVAVLGGAGGSKVRDVPPDADVFVTGDIGYHDALTAQERGLCLIDAGHAATEKCILPVLVKCIAEEFESLRVSLYEEGDVFEVLTRQERRRSPGNRPASRRASP